MCENNELKRVHYTTGMLLSVDDFTAEQDYFKQKNQRHCRYLHGWGVVSGLDVQVLDEMVVIEPGMAIDCAGNDLFHAEHTKCALPKKKAGLYVVIEYSECDSDPIPSLQDPGKEAESAQVYSRVIEGCCVNITEIDTNANHIGIGPGTPGCGKQHPVTIARLVNRAKGWKVIAMGRR